MKSQHVVVLGLHIRTVFTPGLCGDVTETNRESALMEQGSNEVHAVMSAYCFVVILLLLLL